jgi:lipoprotein-anchoring transpeptidase ErfK/SrfK
MRQTKAKAVVLAVVLMATAALAETAPSKRQVIVSIPDCKLALLEGGRLVKVYPVAVGAEVTPSPTGQFSIVSRVVNPTYSHKGKVIAPGPRNPLGSRWMGLSQKGYGIHGTNAPKSIGKAASHGCIRMAKADLEELFQIVRVGDTVEIRLEADAQTEALFGTTTVVAEAQPVPGTPAGAGQ